MIEVLKQIWALKWYEVFVIAAADDVILFIKLWPVWIVIIVIMLMFIFLKD